MFGFCFHFTRTVRFVNFNIILAEMGKHSFRGAITLLAILSLQWGVHAKNILFYAGICTASHVTSIAPLMDRLAEQHGYNVTLLTPYLPPKISPKVNVIFAEEIFDVFRDQWDEGADLIQAREVGFSLWDGILDNALHVCRTFLQARSSQALIHNSQFDLVVVDSAFNECGVGLARLKYKCPFILYSSLGPLPNFHDEFGLPIESGISDMESRAPAGDAMTLWDRVIAIWLPFKWLWRRHMNYYPKLNALLKDQMDMSQEPNIADLQSQASLILSNTHHSTDHVRSFPPLYIPIGGIGIREERETLPADIEAFLKKGSQGFIYVCFGSAVQISKSKPELRAKLFSAFDAFPELQFVWKWEGEVPQGVPGNIYFASWLPQQDLFADKRARGFIGHGGMNGILEAVHFELPTILFPLFGEQDHNAQGLVTKGLVRLLEITDFNQQELVEAIDAVLHDKEFHARVKLASRVMKDRPQTPIETAVWWIEYVLRHGDTSFLRPLSANQSWYKKRFLDVWLVLFSVATVVIVVLVKIVRWLLIRGTVRHSRLVNGSISASAVSNQMVIKH